MSNAENMFKEAALIQLTATCWSIDKKLPQELLSDVGNPDFLKGKKLLLNPESTALIKQVIGKARNYLRKIALPFPIVGCLLIPKKLIPDAQEYLTKLEWDYNSCVDDFLRWYPQEVDDARESLGELFDETDYPTKETIRDKFKFTWRYVTVGPSNSRVLPPSVYRQEMAKFQNLMEQARVDALSALRQEFVDLVSNITDKLSGSEDGKPKRLRESSVANLMNFLNNFSERNLFEDENLQALVEQCRSIISGTSAERIRSNTQVKEKIHSEMSALLDGISDDFVDLPRRKLRFAA